MGDSHSYLIFSKLALNPGNLITIVLSEVFCAQVLVSAPSPMAFMVSINVIKRERGDGEAGALGS